MKNVNRSMALLAASATAVSTLIAVLALQPPAGANEKVRAGPSDCRGIGTPDRPGRRTTRSRLPHDLTAGGTVASGHTDPRRRLGGLSVPGAANPRASPVSSSTATSPTRPRSTRRTAGTTTRSS